MNKTLSLAAAAFFAFTSFAHASTVDVWLGNTSSDISYSTGVTGNTPNIDLSTLGGSLVLNNAVVVNPAVSVANLYAKPTGSIYANNYLAVEGIPTVGSATFTLSQNVFSFTWGTIDTYNSLVLTDARNVSYTITGADILAHIAGSVSGQTQADVVFTDPLANIVKAVLISTNNAFEAANFGQAVVPLPPALWLFMAALVSLMVVAKRNKREAI